MTTDAGAYRNNEAELKKNLDTETFNQLRDLGFGSLLVYVVGALPGAVIGILISICRSDIRRKRELAQELIRKQYGDNRILCLGQQVLGEFPPEHCWDYVHFFGGTLWVEHFQVTNENGLNSVVFWHPDHRFQLSKVGIVRVYRSAGPKCMIDDVPTIKAGA
jgi:hypothetical protein